MLLDSVMLLVPFYVKFKRYLFLLLLPSVLFNKTWLIIRQMNFRIIWEVMTIVKFFIHRISQKRQVVFFQWHVIIQFHYQWSIWILLFSLVQIHFHCFILFFASEKACVLVQRLIVWKHTLRSRRVLLSSNLIILSSWSKRLKRFICILQHLIPWILCFIIRLRTIMFWSRRLKILLCCFLYYSKSFLLQRQIHFILNFIYWLYSWYWWFLIYISILSWLTLFDFNW